MSPFDRAASIGALLLAIALIGYAIFEFILYPAAGFPTQDYGVIVAGVNILRIGHVLKLGYAMASALLMVGFYERLREKSLLLAQLAAVAGVAAVTMFLASSLLGLRILDVAQDTFATNRPEAETTILLRTVTIALFEAAIMAVGALALLISLAARQTNAMPSYLVYPGILIGLLFVIEHLLTDPLAYAAPLFTIPWAFGLAYWLRNQAPRRATSPAVPSEHRIEFDA